MKITAVREVTIALASTVRNADIAFDTMTASAVCVVSDVKQAGRPLVGLAFDSIGRYGHGGLLVERFSDRLLAAHPDDYASELYANNLDPNKAWQLVMRNEKAGGHGERAGAVGLLDSALWDLAAKVEDVPLWRLLHEQHGRAAADVTERRPRVAVYCSGGHYHATDDVSALRRELYTAKDAGFTRCKIKIGGAGLINDMRRVEAAVAIMDGDGKLAVDANAIFHRELAHAYLEALAPLPLAWIEEPVGPLDYALYAELAAAYLIPIATGENLFSAADLRNLLQYGGLNPQRDLLQMDVALAYGIPEYLRMLDCIEAAGFSRSQCLPHAGHLFALHTVAGLGLGAHETALDPNLPIAGFSEDARFEDGYVTLGDVPGVGIEAHQGLYPLFESIIP